MRPIQIFDKCCFLEKKLFSTFSFSSRELHSKHRRKDWGGEAQVRAMLDTSKGGEARDASSESDSIDSDSIENCLNDLEAALAAGLTYKDKFHSQVIQIPISQFPISRIPILQIPNSQIPILQIPKSRIPISRIPLVRFTPPGGGGRG